MVDQVGITDPSTQILLNGIYALTGWIAATVGAFCHDRFGRRTMFMASTCGMAICLAIVAGGSAGYVNAGSVPASDAGIAFIFVFGVVFAVAFTSMQPIYPAEVMTNDMRAKGMFLMQWTSGAAGFLNTFVAPIALKNIGYWVRLAKAITQLNANEAAVLRFLCLLGCLRVCVSSTISVN